MNAFIDEHRARLGVEPICRALQVAPSAYRRHAARHRNPALLPARAVRDAQLLAQVQRVYDQNLRVYGADKVWRQLRREGTGVARCTVERLMRQLGLSGARRGKAVRTTVPDAKAACPLDRVNRQFKAERPNQLWVADFTYVSTWQGFVYVAFVVDVFARRIVGWRVSSSMQTDFVLDALEQALYARRSERDGELVHHSDRGSQYVSIRYSERLAEAGIEPSVGSTGAATTTPWPRPSMGCTRPRSSIGEGRGRRARRSNWRRWSGFRGSTHHRLLEPIGYIPPAEAEANYWRDQGQSMPPSKPAQKSALQEGLNHEYMAQPGGPPAALRGAESRRIRTANTPKT